VVAQAWAVERDRLQVHTIQRCKSTRYSGSMLIQGRESNSVTECNHRM